MKRALQILAALLITQSVAVEAFAAKRLPVVTVSSVTAEGRWHYYINRSNGQVSDGYLDIAQSGNKLATTNTNEANYLLYGTMISNSIDFSLVVNGEELEGYVLHGEGHVSQNKLFAVFQDSQGHVGSFTALKE